MTAPMDRAAVEHAITEELERRQDLIDIIQAQIQRDRDFYKHLYTVTGIGIGILVAVAGAVSYTSISQMRADAKQAVDTTLSLVQSQTTAATESARVTVQKELADVRTEVQQRIDTEFRRENIAQLVEAAAAKRTGAELAGDIRRVAAAQVDAGIKAQSGEIRQQVENQTKEEVQTLRPEISTIISEQLKKQVSDSVAPVEAKMKEYGDTISVERLSILAENGDRQAFEQLGTIYAPPELEKLAKSGVLEVVRKYTNPIRRMQYTFKKQPSPAELLDLLKTSPYPQERTAALDHIPQTPNDVAILPTIVETIKNDGDLEVVTTAFMVFDNITKQQFYFPDFKGIADWWATNRSTLLPSSPSK